MHYLLRLIPIVSLCCCSAAFADTLPPPDASEIQTATEKAVAILNTIPSKTSTSLESFVVRAYRATLKRDPETIEFKTALYLCTENGLPPGDLIGLLLRDSSGKPSWKTLRSFSQSFRSEEFAPTPEDTAKANALALAPISFPTPEISQTVSINGEKTAFIPNETYHTYFGIVHAHSALSDGVGTPEEAYAYARDVAQLDFFSLSDHGEYLWIWPWNNKWQQMVNAADAVNVSGTFVALYGFEWSNPIMGHTNVINSNGFTDTITHFWPGSLYAWMGEQPQCFGMFNHPHEIQWAGTFVIDSFHGNQMAVNQIVGVELASYYDLDPVFYGTVHGKTKNFWDLANGEGWMLGALGNQDNHEANWGNANNIRTGVLAKELTRDAIVEAYHQRRFYVTEDKNLVLDFRCNGYPMGAQIQTNQRQFQVTAEDGNGDTFEQVRLYCNGTLLETQTVTGNPITATFEDTQHTGNDYYYVVVRQTDDEAGNDRNDEAVSSPIWIQAQEDETVSGCNVLSKADDVRKNSLADILVFFILLLTCVRRRKMTR